MVVKFQFAYVDCVCISSVVLPEPKALVVRPEDWLLLLLKNSTALAETSMRSHRI